MYKLLIVDDEVEITSMLSRYFNLNGYDCDVANSMQEASNKIEHSQYQVVISDISMPEQSGIELLSWIKNYDGSIHVIMITGYITQSNILDTMRLGADTCLFKPLEDLEVLRSWVDKAFERRKMWIDVLSAANEEEVRGGSHGTV